jgi:hypothetical protein
MFGRRGRVPDVVPVLAQGRHRSPRKGACFMEMASYLAGEPWSDRPRCTHPLLAGLARLVNDHTTDDGRDRLVELVPSVVGLTCDDPRADVSLMVLAATTALPVVSAERQRALAVALLTGARVLDELDGRPGSARVDGGRGPAGDASRAVLDQVPDAARWARRFAGELGAGGGVDAVRRHAAPAAVRQAVVGIAEACTPDPDGLLHDLLVDAIAACAALASPRERVEGPRVPRPAPAG